MAKPTGSAEALDALAAVTVDFEITIPVINFDDPMFDLSQATIEALTAEIKKPVVEDITTGSPGGTGVFDKLMKSFKAHLREEYDADRIVGADYTRAYTELTATTMQQSIAFVLGREQAYWVALTAQIAAVTARVQLVSEKVRLAQLLFQAQTAKAEYGLTVMKIGTESAQYETLYFGLTNLLPLQSSGLQLENANKTLTGNVLTQQALNLDADRNVKQYQVQAVLPAQVALYNQQVISYKRDVEAKVAKVFADCWVTMKTLDEGLNVPGALTNAGIDSVLANFRNFAGMG